MLSPLDAITLHVDACYRQGAGLRLTSINDGTGHAAPRFYLGRTADGNTWRFREDVPAALIARLEESCRQEPVLGDPPELPVHYEKYIALLDASAAIAKIWSGPAYHFHGGVAGDAQSLQPTIEITAADAEMLRLDFDAWRPHVRESQPFIGSIVDDRVVAVCASVRITHYAHEAGVETAPAYRGKGYARAAVSAWATAVARIGATPMFSTAWQNTASQRVANRLALIRFGVDFHIT